MSITQVKPLDSYNKSSSNCLKSLFNSSTFTKEPGEGGIHSTDVDGNMNETYKLNV